MSLTSEHVISRSNISSFMYFFFLHFMYLAYEEMCATNRNVLSSVHSDHGNEHYFRTRLSIHFTDCREALTLRRGNFSRRYRFDGEYITLQLLYPAPAAAKFHPSHVCDARHPGIHKLRWHRFPYVIIAWWKCAPSCTCKFRRLNVGN